jgi:hypothetical protein
VAPVRPDGALRSQVGLDPVEDRHRQRLIPEQAHANLHPGGLLANLGDLDRDLLVLRGARDEDGGERIVLLADPGELELFDGQVDGAPGLQVA